MADGKIQFELGGLKFAGEGSETWVAQQLNIVLNKLPELNKLGVIEAPSAVADPAQPAPKKQVAVGSLASHIKAKGGDTNQQLRFLAAADWLRLKGEVSLKAGLVAKALSDHHQKKLANPADCLNKNVNKGLCEKAADGFFITPEGLTELGHDD